MVGDDSVIDVDVLPNRAHDCLSHRGIAKELSALFSMPLKRDVFREEQKKIGEELPLSKILSVEIDDVLLCRRYAGAVIQGVKVDRSPDWLKKRIEAVGQKSINNIVDATNFVMLNLGQPLHAFDMKKLKENSGKVSIVVRNAKNGEKICTLGGEEYELDTTNLLITDGNAKAPIGIAGVKGGKLSEIDEETTDIIIESANFHPVSIRKTSQRLKLRTDASTRFENELSPESVYYGITEVVKLIVEIAGGDVEGFVDMYPKQADDNRAINLSTKDINKLLGTSIDNAHVEDILKRLDFAFTLEDETYTVTAPFERRDISIPADVIEEIGRMYGYENIGEEVPQKEREVPVRKKFYYAERIRDFLTKGGFTEVYTYSLRNNGELELENPLASDKNFMRITLQDGIRDSIALNEKNKTVLGLDNIKIFEIGNVFLSKGEHTSVCIGVSQQDENIENTIINLFEELHTESKGEWKNNIYEFNLDAILDSLEEPDTYNVKSDSESFSYKPFSLFPPVLRDISVWVPESLSSEEILSMIKSNAGDLLVQSHLFDEYKKNGKMSYAFNLTFQSDEKTLSEDEINKVMKKITDHFNKQSGFEVR